MDKTTKLDMCKYIAKELYRGDISIPTEDDKIPWLMKMTKTRLRTLYDMAGMGHLSDRSKSPIPDVIRKWHRKLNRMEIYNVKE